MTSGSSLVRAPLPAPVQFRTAAAATVVPSLSVR